MEIDPRYVQVTIERWQGLTGEKAVRVDDWSHTHSCRPTEAPVGAIWPNPKRDRRRRAERGPWIS